MKSSSKNKFILIGLVVVVIALAAGGGYFFLNSQKSGNDGENGELSDEIVATVTADELGLTLTPTNNNQAILMEITNLTGIESIDYEVSYDAVENGEVVPRGAIGFIELEGESSIEREIDLGTCSRNICKYDKGVEKVKLVLRINYTDGSVGALEEEIEL